MNDETLINCVKCEKTLPTGSFYRCILARSKTRPACKDCLSFAQKEWHKRKGKEHFKNYKAAKRKAAGARVMKEIQEEARARKSEMELKRASRQAAKMTSAEQYRKKWQDEQFRQKERARSRSAKARLPDWYVNYRLSNGSGMVYPTALVELKRAQLSIQRLLRDQHEKC